MQKNFFEEFLVTKYTKGLKQFKCFFVDWINPIILLQLVTKQGVVVSRLVMNHTKVLMYHTIVLLARLTKVRC
jgi:hypothetical protein